MWKSILAGVILALSISHLATAQSALTGAITSTEEGRMEGVLVSAKLESSNKIVTVVSNAEGVYSFPRNRLEGGRYQLSIRAVGYVLPGASKLPVNVTRDTTAHLDMTLRKSNILELAIQLTDPEWL